MTTIAWKHDRPFRNPAGHPEPLLEPVDRALREVALRVVSARRRAGLWLS